MHTGTSAFQRFILAALSSLMVAPAWADEPATVLVLYSNNRLLPGNVIVDAGLREVLTKPTDRPVLSFAEFLDVPEFGGQTYERAVTAYLHEKYAARPPAVVVAVSDDALRFLLLNRTQLFPATPIVHIAVSQSYLRSLAPLPDDVVGVPVEYDYSGTIEQALRWHPKATRLVIVTGSSERDRRREARLRNETPTVASRVAIEFLAGLTTDALLQRLRSLDADTVVFTPGYFQDAAGRQFSPRESAGLIAAASSAPVYGPADTFIGTGVVGGYMPNFEDMGREGARIVMSILGGAAPASLVLPALAPTALRVDWREARRWKISEAQIPADAIVYFREPTFWEMYRTAVIVTAAVIVLQAGLIAALLLERRRRRRVELANQAQRSELAHVSRLAIAGELTASIAHEINQPLGAILTNADAAELLLDSGADRRDDLRRILADIRRDDLRASDVIRRLRTLLAKHEVEREVVDLNEAASDAANLLRAEARRRQVSLEVRSAPNAASVVADPIQIQQVLINLVLNAMDAMEDVPEPRREAVLSVEQNSETVGVAVHDRGHGIDPGHLPRLFDSFFSTKRRGMGLGLSIARTIVEAHGGRISAGNNQPEGAVFRIVFPVSASTYLSPGRA